MRIERLGESAAILRDLEEPAFVLADRINRSGKAGLFEAVASYDTVGIYFDPDRLDPMHLQISPSTGNFSPESHEVPVCYELGPDLDLVAQQLNLSAQEVVQSHTSATYTCFAIGFSPGFPYLGWLPERIAGISRRATPRTRVDPGSVGITGTQTGIYPQATPGGWNLIGLTPLILVDLEDDYFPITAGDQVRFVPISPSDYNSLKGNRL